MLELLALLLIQLATILGTPAPNSKSSNAPSAPTTQTVDTGGGIWGEGH